MHPDVNVTEVRDFIQFEQGGAMTEMTRVTYYVRRYGPFTHAWKKADYSLTALEIVTDEKVCNLPPARG